jgi:hypothetical protein
VITAHQFARQLLAGPDLPIFVPKAIEYYDGDNCIDDPFVSEEEGIVAESGQPTTILLIDRPRRPSSSFLSPKLRKKL